MYIYIYLSRYTYIHIFFFEAVAPMDMLKLYLVRCSIANCSGSQVGHVQISRGNACTRWKYDHFIFRNEDLPIKQPKQYFFCWFLFWEIFLTHRGRLYKHKRRKFRSDQPRPISATGFLVHKHMNCWFLEVMYLQVPLWSSKDTFSNVCLETVQ